MSAKKKPAKKKTSTKRTAKKSAKTKLKKAKLARRKATLPCNKIASIEKIASGSGAGGTANEARNAAYYDAVLNAESSIHNWISAQYCPYDCKVEVLYKKHIDTRPTACSVDEVVIAKRKRMKREVITVYKATCEVKYSIRIGCVDIIDEPILEDEVLIAM